MKGCCNFERSLRKAAPWLAAAAVVVAVALMALPAGAQFRGFQAASVMPSAPVALTAGKTIEVPIVVRVRPRYHINSNEPLEDYLIPTAVTWETAGVEVASVEFPEPELVTYAFSESPLSVFSDEFTIVSKLKVPPTYKGGIESLTGKLRYQACNDKSCLAPTSADFSVPVR